MGSKVSGKKENFLQTAIRLVLSRICLAYCSSPTAYFFLICLSKPSFCSCFVILFCTFALNNISPLISFVCVFHITSSVAYSNFLYLPDHRRTISTPLPGILPFLSSPSLFRAVPATNTPTGEFKSKVRVEPGGTLKSCTHHDSYSSNQLHGTTSVTFILVVYVMFNI